MTCQLPQSSELNDIRNLQLPILNSIHVYTVMFDDTTQSPRNQLKKIYYKNISSCHRAFKLPARVWSVDRFLLSRLDCRALYRWATQNSPKSDTGDSFRVIVHVNFECYVEEDCLGVYHILMSPQCAWTNPKRGQLTTIIQMIVLGLGKNRGRVYIHLVLVFTLRGRE